MAITMLTELECLIRLPYGQPEALKSGVWIGESHDR